MTMSAETRGMPLASRLKMFRTTKSWRGAFSTQAAYSLANRTLWRGETATKISSSFIVSTLDGGSAACTKKRPFRPRHSQEGVVP